MQDSKRSSSVPDPPTPPDLSAPGATTLVAVEPEVLIADDDPRNHMAFAEMLTGLDLRVTMVSSGRQALSHLLRKDYAALVLDVRMPGMDGFETASVVRARERTRHVPIIFITAYGQDEIDIGRGYRLGAVDYLFKPIVAEALRAKLQVFADLFRRTTEVERQAAWIREVERRDHLRLLEHERRKWEAASLKRRMEEQERLNAQLAEIDQRKDEFIALLAHELRNPLAPIVTSLELIRSRAVNDEFLRSATGTMERQIHHLTHLLDDLLDVSRISRGKVKLEREGVDLGDLIGEALAWCRPTLESKQHRLIVIAPESPTPIHADSVRMIQVVSNLINNAVRYSDDGSAITVEWGVKDAGAFARVSDEGRGISPELIEHIFDSFVQGSSESGGLGLGLTLVKRIVELHDGTVEAHSPGPNQGSDFVIRLPLFTGAIRPLAEPRAPLCETPAPLCIAVIEDDQDVRAGLADVLELWGHQVRVAINGPTGVDLLVGLPHDVALVDIGLPGLDGYGVVERVLEVLGDTAPRFIALTGFGQSTHRARGASVGFQAHMVKPPDLEELRRLLAETPARCKPFATRATPAGPAPPGEHSV